LLHREPVNDKLNPPGIGVWVLPSPSVHWMPKESEFSITGIGFISGLHCLNILLLVNWFIKFKTEG
jgi:hypothetical protein